MTIVYGRRGQLGDFLRRRREALSPEAAGITVRERRRTPGLRRDEVAERANMSVVYYERLERGRGPLPSSSMLNAIARALRLNSEESHYLYRLGGQQAPATREPVGFVDPALLSAMNAVSPTVPAVITDELYTVLAENATSRELLGSMADDEAPEPNIIRRWFTEPTWRDQLAPADRHDEIGRFFVARLRSIAARHCEDREVLAFSTALVNGSDEFQEKWAEHTISTVHSVRLRIDHDRIGPVELDSAMVLSPDSSQRLILLQPAPGTDSAERLARLHTLVV